MARKPIWWKGDPAIRARLERLSRDARATWYDVQIYCVCVGNDGALRKSELHVAVYRCVSLKQVTKDAAELIDAGLWVDRGVTYEMVDWFPDQLKAGAFDDDEGVRSELRRKALQRDRALCARIQQRDKDLCRYCGVWVNWKDKRGDDGATYDHRDPFNVEGPGGYGNTFANVVVSCRGCNTAKGKRTPEQAAMPLLAPGTAASGLGRGSGPDLAGAKSDLAHGQKSPRVTRDSGPSQIEAKSGPDRGQVDPSLTGPEHHAPDLPATADAALGEHPRGHSHSPALNGAAHD